MDDGSLLCSVERLAERVAEWPSHEDRAWCTKSHREIAKHGDRDSGCSPRLDCPLDQSDGLMAEPSRGNEEHEIGLLGAQPSEQTRNAFV